MAKRERKPLNDKLAESFVYGKQAEPEPTQIIEPTQPNKPKQATQKTSNNLLENLEMPAREPTIRLTVDLAESVHKKLSILAAKSGRKKVEIVRMLLDQALADVED